MPKVRCTADFDWTDPRNRNATTAYKKGHEITVTTPCAEAAVKKGKAVVIGPDTPTAPAAEAPK